MRVAARERERAQALVEFSLTIVIFLVMLMAIVDLGRGIYMFNGVSQAVREVARVASVHPGTTFGNSPEITSVVATQKRLIPNLSSPTFACVEIDDTSYPGGTCPASKGYRVKVTMLAPYAPLTPILGLIGTWNMSSTSSLEIP